MINEIIRLYFFTLPFILFLFSFTSFVDHGYIKLGFTKNFFILLYLFAIILHFFLHTINFYMIHLLRRFFECFLFRYKNSKMSFLQLLHGIIYYFFISLHLSSKKIIYINVWICLNIVHTITHYFVFKKRKFLYSHYFIELCIYFYLYIEFRSVELLFNLWYLIIFILITLKNRIKVEKLI